MPSRKNKTIPKFHKIDFVRFSPEKHLSGTGVFSLPEKLQKVCILVSLSYL